PLIRIVAIRALTPSATSGRYYLRGLVRLALPPHLHLFPYTALFRSTIAIRDRESAIRSRRRRRQRRRLHGIDLDAGGMRHLDIAWLDHRAVVQRPGAIVCVITRRSDQHRDALRKRARIDLEEGLVDN